MHEGKPAKYHNPSKLSFCKQNYTCQKGAVPLLLLIAAIGVVSFLAVSSVAPLRNQLLTTLFPKPASQAATTIGKYDVFEQTLTYTSTNLTNPWEQVTVTATLTSPSNKTLIIDGFYYDTDTYKVRFTPTEIGTYNYSITINGPNGNPAPTTGSFDSVASSNKGFVRKLPGSQTRLMFEDGSFFNGVGFNDCWDSTEAQTGNLTGQIGDPAIEPAGEGGQIPLSTYFQKYGSEGGFNLFRWNPGNCSFDITSSISTTGNVYKVAEGKSGDILLSTAKANGFHTMYTFFIFPPYPNAHTNQQESDATKKAIRYAMARYGAYVDIWELSNETDLINLADGWVSTFANFVRSNDPYQRLITNSNPRTNDAALGLDIKSPHQYGQSEDHYMLSISPNMQTIVGEAGRCCSQPVNVYDAQVVALMRMNDWTSIFGGAGYIYWNSSFRTTCCNQYMGSKERAQNRVLADVTQNLDVDSVPSRITNFNPSSFKVGYLLTGTNNMVAYIYDNRLTTSGNTSTSFTTNVPFSGTASWIDTRIGATISSSAVTAGSNTFTTPTFTEDIALKVTSSAPSSPTPVPSPTPTPTPTPAPSPTPSPNLVLSPLLSTSFDNAQSVTSPVIGTGVNSAIVTTPQDDFVAGKTGSGIQIDAAGEYVSFLQTDGSVSNIELDKGEIEFWFKSSYSHTDGIRHSLVGIGAFSTSPGGIHIEKNNLANGNSLTVYLWDLAGAIYETSIPSTSYSFTPGVWVHIRVTWDSQVAPGAPNTRIFVDSVEGTYAERSLGPLTMTQESTSQNIFVGIRSQGGTAPANGVFDDLKISTLVPAPSPTPSSPPIPGDIDGNSKVDIFDYNFILTDFGSTSGTGLRSDLDSNNKVDIFDYNILLTNFGRTS